MLCYRTRGERPQGKALLTKQPDACARAALSLSVGNPADTTEENAAQQQDCGPAHALPRPSSAEALKTEATRARQRAKLLSSPRTHCPDQLCRCSCTGSACLASLSHSNRRSSQCSPRALTLGAQSLARGAAASRIGCSFSAMAMLPPIFSLRIRNACRSANIRQRSKLGKAAFTPAETAAPQSTCGERGGVHTTDVQERPGRTHVASLLAGA